MWFLMLAGCKQPTPALVDVRRVCQTACASELRTEAERSICRGQVLACEIECRALLDGEGLPCVECLETNGVYGPLTSENDDGALVCHPAEVTRGGCTHICPVVL